MNQQMAGAIVIILIVAAVFFLIGLAIFAMFLLTLHRTMDQVRPGLRKISPGTVWFCLIPIFGGFFAIWVVQAVADSLRKQFEELDAEDRSSSYGKTAGLLWTLPSIVSYVILIIGFALDLTDIAGLINNVLALISFVSWIVYWVQISGFGRRLKSLKRSDYSSDELDYDDDLEEDRDYR